MAILVSAAVSATKLVDKVPDVVAESVVNAVKNNKSISSSLLLDMTTGFNKKVDKYFNYGLANFVNGLPSTSTASDATLVADKQAAVKAVVETIVGEPIKIVELKIGYINYIPIAKEYIQGLAGYTWDGRTEEVTIPGSLDTDGLPIKWTIVGASEYNGFIRITFRNRASGAAEEGISAFYLTTPLVPSLQNEVYYSLVYSLVSDIYYNRLNWTYKESLATHPTLNIVGSVILGTQYLPIAPIRRDKQNVVDDKTFNPYEAVSTRKLLKTINLKLDDVTNALTDSNDPAALNDVDEAFIMFAIDMNSSTDIAIMYQYEHFRAAHYSDSVLQQEWLAWDSNPPTAVPPLNRTNIQDNTIDLVVQHNFTNLVVKTGLITSNPAAPDPLVAVPYVLGIDASNTGGGTVTRQLIAGTSYDIGSSPSYYNRSTIVYRKQLTTIAGGDTTNTYAELTVYGFQIVNNIYKQNTDGIVVRDISNMSDGGLFLPVSYDISRQFSGFDEALIYYESLQLIIYALHIQQLSWFQSSAFRAIVTFVIVVISIVTNTEGFVNGILDAFASTSAFVEAVSTLVLNYIIGIFLVEAFSVVISELGGGDIALILSAVLAIVAVFYLGKGDKLFGLLDANKLLLISTSLTAANNKVIQDDFLKLEKDTEDFMKSADELQEKIDEANDLLDNGINLDLFSIKRVPPQPNFNESPDMFYRRTIHNTNPGVLVLKAIEHYVGINLELPKPANI